MTALVDDALIASVDWVRDILDSCRAWCGLHGLASAQYGPGTPPELAEPLHETAERNGTAYKRIRARDALASLMRERRAVISTQVLQEFFAAATRKLRIPPERARSHIEKWSKIDVVVIRPEIILGAIDP